MGSSVEADMKAIDASVGGLVWVRRRNGSWWPGRILGPEELPEGSLISPRSGTPVKLLGREDASVDWYNLEKSRRVKAFRCGEYDECIEKAKASVANSSKKVVKYARREDAILHALEIESSFQPIEPPDSGLNSIDNQGGDHIDHNSDEEKIEELTEELTISDEIANSAHELSQSGVSFEEPNHMAVPRRRRRTPNDSEDDGTEGIKRMKGLEDLGVGVVSSLKRKRSQVAHVQEFLKRKNRRRQLTKVLESTAMVSVPIMCETLAGPAGSPVAVHNNSDSTGVSCENGTSLNASEHGYGPSSSSLVNGKQKENEISSVSVLPDSNKSSDGLFDVPFVGEEGHLPGFSEVVVSLKNDEVNESGSTSSGAAEITDITRTIEKSTSKWQSKGKRNSRNTSRNKKQDFRKLTDVNNESDAHFAGNVFSGGSYRNIDSGLNWYVSDQDQTRTMPYRQSRFTVNPKYDLSDFPIRSYSSDSMLYDVNLEVKASYRPQHVPYISLMSKLNGQPIIGHPLTIEVLEDGFCESLMAGPASLDTGVKVSKSPKSRKNGLLSKKIRKLSSLTGSNRHNNEDKKPVVEKLKGPAVACIPIKIVFSRINAALSCSTRPSTQLLIKPNSP